MLDGAIVDSIHNTRWSTLDSGIMTTRECIQSVVDLSRILFTQIPDLQPHMYMKLSHELVMWDITYYTMIVINMSCNNLHDPWTI
jgi:hypothetical protein